MSIGLRARPRFVSREGGTIGRKPYRVWLQIVDCPVAGDSALSEEKECYAQHGIREKQESSLEPVRFRVPNHR